jgi:hypothetical protein
VKHQERINLLSQAEQMKRLHIKTAKNLSKNLLEEALLEDGIDGEENIEEEIQNGLHSDSNNLHPND